MTTADLGGYTILLVDDVEFSRTIVAHMIDRLGHPKILKASDGAVALRMLENHPEIDVIISDFNMPNVNGLTLLKEIRCGYGEVPTDLPFAMLTGHADKELVDIALLLDVNAFIVKPVSQDGIARRLKAIFKHAETARPRAERIRYDEIDVEGASAIRLSVDTSIESLIKSEIGLWEDESTAAPKPPSGPDAKRADDTDFMKWRVKRAAEVSSKLSFLKDMLGSELGKRIVRNIDRLIVGTGVKSATAVVESLNDMVSIGDIGPGDVNSILTIPDMKIEEGATWRETVGSPVDVPEDAREAFVSLLDIPEHAILKGSLSTKGGVEIFGARTTLGPQSVSILRRMARMNLLKLEKKDGEVGVRVLLSGPPGRGHVFVEDPAERPVFDREVQISVDNIKVGETVTRDIFSDSGTLFLSGGTKLSGRMTTILKDLADLNRIEKVVWIADEVEDTSSES